jgi:hypothetical protein
MTLVTRDRDQETCLKGAVVMERLRRILLSLGAVAAFLMAAGAGWRN